MVLKSCGLTQDDVDLYEVRLPLPFPSPFIPDEDRSMKRSRHNASMLCAHWVSHSMLRPVSVNNPPDSPLRSEKVRTVLLVDDPVSRLSPFIGQRERWSHRVRPSFR